MMDILESEGVKPETAKPKKKKKKVMNMTRFAWMWLHYVFCFFLCYMACGILVPQSGIKPRPIAVKALSLNR